MRLQGKVSIISAGASGMGKAGAIRFAKEGAVVNILDIDKTKGEEVVHEIQVGGGKAHFYQVDLLNLSDVERTIAEINKQCGKINILWNHVGIPGPADLEGVKEDAYDQAMDVNVKSSFFTTKYVVPFMRKTGGGSVIFTASTAGLKASPFSPVYSAGKGAIVNMVRSLAVRYGKEGIRFNCICPGLTETPMMEKFLTRSTENDLEKNKQFIMSNIPLGRLAKPIDIANAALFLASDEAEYISGIHLPVDGAYLVK